MDKTIRMAHGAGGLLSHRLHDFIIDRLGVTDTSGLADAALLSLEPIIKSICPSAERLGRIAFTTDGYVVQPRCFPGGDIGRLAVCGTINDLSVMGAVPVFLSLSLIIEEGFTTEELAFYLDSIARTESEAGVNIVTGDTKVVDSGSADGLFITTSGIGYVPDSVDIGPRNAAVGQKIVINGTVGDHSIAVISARENLSFAGQVESDCAPLNNMIQRVLRAVPGKVKVMRDPTRGGLASALNEIATSSEIGIQLHEAKLPVDSKVQAASSLLGYDILHLANEGKCLFFVEDTDGAPEQVVSELRKDNLGRDAAIIGEVVDRSSNNRLAHVTMKTRIGGTRIVDVLTGELLPRIC